MPEMIAERLDEITHLDFDPFGETHDSEVCEAYSDCDRKPEWRFIPRLSCKHDGRVLLACTFHQKLADNYFYTRRITGDEIFCTDCGESTRLLGWRWERM